MDRKCSSASGTMMNSKKLIRKGLIIPSHYTNLNKKSNLKPVVIWQRNETGPNCIIFLIWQFER